MTMIANGARLAILERGVAGLLIAGGGSCQVRLLRNGTEISGNGYARQRLTEFSAAALAGGSLPTKSSVAVNITASGGSLTFDQVELWNFSGSTLLLRSEYCGDQVIANGTTVAVTIRLATPEPTPYFWDVTVDQQLSEIGGRRPTIAVDVPAAYPWLLPDDSVYQQPVFDRAARFRGQVEFDHEPNTATLYETGTIRIQNGVVTGTGTNFPTYGTNARYFRQLKVNGLIYAVSNAATTATAMTLVDTSVNVAAGTAYKYAPWDFRETDPKFATNTQEWHNSHDEYAIPLEIILPACLQNGCGIGIYEFCVHLYRRQDDICGDVTPGSELVWKSQVQDALNYTTANGRKLRDYVDLTGGKFYLTCYNASALNGNVGAQNRFIDRTSYIQETMQEFEVPYVLMFLRHTQNVGYGQFYANLPAEEVDRDFMARQIQAAHANDPGCVGFWGSRNPAGVREYDLSESDDYRDYIEETIATLAF